MKLVKPLPKNGKKVKKLEFRLHLTPKNILVWVLVLFLGLSFLSSLTRPGLSAEEIDLTRALNDVKEKKVKQILVDGDRLLLTYQDDQKFLARKEPNESLVKTFETAGIDPKSVEIKVVDQTLTRAFSDILGTILPLILMAVFFLYIFRQAKGAQDNIFSFGQSRAKIFAKGKQAITFKDVAGVDEAKKELEEIVDFLKHPQKYRALGARTPKGALLVGPSGVGKTLLAKAVAGEAGVPFFSMAGSEFMEMLVGVGASRVRDLFNTAKKAAPSIIFIDEIDAIGRQRGQGVFGGGGHDEREQTLNQILVEMDGFTPNDNVFVIAASVVGETPIMIKQGGETDLTTIGKFVDQYYENQNQEGEIEVDDVYCLGMERKRSNGNLTHKNLYFDHSAFKGVSSVFRHKVKEIYEIEYLGGKMRATGNHSVFIRSPKGIVTKAVTELKKGDVLVDLPYKVNRGVKTKMEVRAHQFDSDWSLVLPFFDQEVGGRWERNYLFATQETCLSQSQIAGTIGVSQGTVSNWQRGIGSPRQISKKYFKHEFPFEVKVTPELCRLLGYYVAEGYARWEVDFCFSIDETEEIEDLIGLTEKIFGILPDRFNRKTHGAVNIVYSATPLAKFLISYCGKGAANKHIPPFLFEAPFEYFKEFLKGVWLGDGYEDKEGRGEITSVSKRLINELNWLCRMHGIKTYIHNFVAKEGRIISGGKPLSAVQAYRLGWGKANNPFNFYKMQKTYPVKRALIKNVQKLPFNGFVYDLCGVDNEAFFGGESPILLHNTNRGDLLDPALLRPGRFDRRVALDMPDLEGRKAILAIHAQGKQFKKGISWEKTARRTVGFSGADLENMLNEAAILAARLNKKEIDEKDLEEAAIKVKLGPEKRRLQSEEDRRMTAYHEAGHALVSYYCKQADPVHRISIVARGMSLGHTLIPPAKDRSHETKSRLLEKISVMMGGRAAEELIFNEMTTGAANDIAQATNLVRAMVVDFGMSDLGPIYWGSQIEQGDLGRVTWYEQTVISPDMQSKIDKEIQKITEEGHKTAKEIVKNNRKKLDRVAEALLEKETLEEEEFAKLMNEK